MIAVWAMVSFNVSSASSDTALAGLLVASLMTLVVQSWLLRGPIRQQLGSGNAITEFRAWMNASLSLLLTQGFFLLATSLDVFILPAMTDPEQVGLYFSAAKIITWSHSSRWLSEAMQTGDRTAFGEHNERDRKMMLWPTLAGVTLITMLSPFILATSGPQFPAAVPVVVILSGGILVQATAGPLQEHLMVMGHQKANAWIIAGSLAFNLVASIAFSLILGITGAALASALSIILRIALMLRVSLAAHNTGI